MKSLNEIAVWIYEERAIVSKQIQQATGEERKYLALTTAMYNKFLDRVKLAGRSEEKRCKRAVLSPSVDTVRK